MSSRVCCNARVTLRSEATASEISPSRRRNKRRALYRRDVGIAGYFYGDSTAMQGVEVDLPKADASPVSDSDAEPLIVSIDAQARLYLNLGASDDQALSMETVKQRVATVLKRNPEKTVMVWGDAAVPYGEVVVLMSELQEAGAPSVGLVTEAPARR